MFNKKNQHIIHHQHINDKMIAQKQKLLQKIYGQLKTKKTELINHLPIIHEIEDGIAIRFFSGWEECKNNKKIKFKKFTSDDDEILYHFFLPKGTYLDIKKRKYAGCIVCLEGHVVLEVDNKLVVILPHTKTCLNSNEYHGKVLKDSYILTRANVKIMQ